MVVRNRISVEQYLSLPEGEKPYLEFANGDVIAKAMPNMDHGVLVQAFGLRLGAYARDHGGRCGPEIRVEFVTTAGPVFRLPDFSYWAAGRPRRGDRAAQPPTLAIEVVSPDDTLAEQREKCAFYVDNGIDEAWLVNPATRTVERFGDRSGLLGQSASLASEALPGFELSLSELFAVLDE